MKLKNLKIYLLTIFAIFLFGFKTQAVIIDINNPIPSNTFNSASAIIRLAQNNINYNNFSLSAEDNIKNILANMRKNSKNVTKSIPIIYANTNTLIQSIHLELNGEEIDLFFQSNIQIIEILSLTNKKCIPDDRFQNLNDADNKNWLINFLKDYIPNHNINLDSPLWEKQIKIEANWESTDNNMCHQFVLVTFNGQFVLFDFQYHPQN